MKNCSRTDLASLLPQWDQLEPSKRQALEEHASECAACGPALGALARADEWLKARATLKKSSARGETTPCPEPDALFRYGRGPGAEALTAEEREAVRAHVETCFECESFVETLAAPPPSPLILDPTSNGGPAKGRVTRRLVAGLGVAAGLMALVMLWRGSTATAAAAGSLRFPRAPVFRGDTDGALLFPRDRVLATSEGLPYSDLLFELTPEDGASGYLVEVYRHDGGAFEEGTRLARIESPEATVQPASGLVSELLPGNYTWEAWAVVDGLDVPLGRRDFEIVLDHEVLDRLARLGRSEPVNHAAVLEVLHPSFPSDARAYARTLPASPERDAYLLRRPKR